MNGVKDAVTLLAKEMLLGGSIGMKPIEILQLEDNRADAEAVVEEEFFQII